MQLRIPLMRSLGMGCHGMSQGSSSQLTPSHTCRAAHELSLTGLRGHCSATGSVLHFSKSLSLSLCHPSDINDLRKVGQDDAGQTRSLMSTWAASHLVKDRKDQALGITEDIRVTILLKS